MSTIRHAPTAREDAPPGRLSADAVAADEGPPDPFVRGALPLVHVLAGWRPGSADWAWADECRDLWGRDRERTENIERALVNQVPNPTSPGGVRHTIDHQVFSGSEPILLGPDGRVWNGHHRICIAIRRHLAVIPADYDPDHYAAIFGGPAPAIGRTPKPASR